MRVISGVAGAALLLVTLGSILRNVVVPRGLGSLLTKGLWRALHRVLISLASVFVAYALLVYAFSKLSLPNSFREAGSSMFTLGFASNARTELNALDFFA